MAIYREVKPARPCYRDLGAGGRCMEPVIPQVIQTEVTGVKAIEIIVCPACDRPEPPTPWYVRKRKIP